MVVRPITVPVGADWRVRGNCRNLKDPDVMTPDPADYRSIAKAKTICGGCPVKDVCLDAAIQRDERFGIWGGLTPAERGVASTMKGRAVHAATRKCRYCNMRRPAGLVVNRQCRSCAVARSLPPSRRPAVAA